ncbi:MAG: aldolase catalytic domain-containing protein [Pseudomonadota bacterium]
MRALTLLDCTLRDGGYYNNWDFAPELIHRYLAAMKAARIDCVELGFRFVQNNGFKGACAYTGDDFIRSLTIPEDLQIGVMLNGADLLTDLGLEGALERLFPETAAQSPVSLVRIACHVHEFEKALPASHWLSERGYVVGFNLMQIADRTRAEVVDLARAASAYPIAVLYFADSMGSMTPEATEEIVSWLREGWNGPIGIHTHDNMGLALRNTLRACEAGATWLDATVTGMGRGPGNARTEELLIETSEPGPRDPNLVPLLELIQNDFLPLKERYGWGSNPYYYLSGKYGIHPTFVQEMVGDARFSPEDILGSIEQLRLDGGKKFSNSRLELAQNFYVGPVQGSWSPATMLEGRDVLLLAPGPAGAAHAAAVARFVRDRRPVVVAFNTHMPLPSELIDLRVACHPVRLLADGEAHGRLPHPLVTPVSMLPSAVRAALGERGLLDFGIEVEPQHFAFGDTACTVPKSMVAAYALAMAASGRARWIFLTGFDGYPSGDPRNDEMNALLTQFQAAAPEIDVISLTPTAYSVARRSIYGHVPEVAA